MAIDVKAIPIIDTHEHIARIYAWKSEDIGLLHVLLENHYLMADLASADPNSAGVEWNDPDRGLVPIVALTAAGGKLPKEKEAEAVEWLIARLPLVAHTSDWKSEQIALHDLFGLNDYLLTRDNWRAIDERVRERYRDREAWYKEVFERANIKTLFWCYGKPLFTGPCRAVLDLGDFTARQRGGAKNFETLKLVFADWFRGAVDELQPASLKVGTAYGRDIAIEEHPGKEADTALLAMNSNQVLNTSLAVTDFVHDLAAEACAEKGLPMQIHTGYLAGNTLENELHKTYAARMERFLARHPGTRFDLFHGSFPQWGEVLTLARHYPNVFVNMCWVPSTSESIAEAMLTAALDAVPVNKIMYGGDAHSPEMAYGVAQLFRGIVERVLEKRDCPDTIKTDAAEWILWQTASELYGIAI
jgi:hypothetical protein